MTSAAVLMTAAIGLFFLGAGLIGSSARLLHDSLSAPAWTHIEPALLVERVWQTSQPLAEYVVVLMLLMVVAAVLINVVQVGFLMAPDAIVPEVSRLDPRNGLKRMVSVTGTATLAGSLGKLAVVATISTWYIRSQLPRFLVLGASEPPQILITIGQSLVKLAFLLALALLALALLDFAFRKWKHKRDLRMTRQEVRDELKHMESDPLIRQRRGDAHRKLALARELHHAGTADVVIAHPKRIAAAVKYDTERMSTPMLVAKGQGETADRICRLAAERGIPIIERVPLAEALFRGSETSGPVPRETDDALAEIMAYVCELSGKRFGIEQPSAEIRR